MWFSILTAIDGNWWCLSVCSNGVCNIRVACWCCTWHSEQVKCISFTLLMSLIMFNGCVSFVNFFSILYYLMAFSVLMLLVGWQEGHPAFKNKWWGAGTVICLKRGADLHIAQVMPLPLTISCFSKKSRLVLPFWYRLTHVVPGKGLLNVCVCVCVYLYLMAVVV